MAGKLTSGESDREEQSWEEDGVRVVRVVDALDIETSPRLRERVGAEFAAGVQRLCIDLDGVTFIDSTGLAAVIDLQRHANLNGAFLALACGEGPVRRLIELAFLERQLPVYPDVPRALEGLRG